jgi:hypothetical protein
MVKRRSIGPLGRSVRGKGDRKASRGSDGPLQPHRTWKESSGGRSRGCYLSTDDPSVTRRTGGLAREGLWGRENTAGIMLSPKEAPVGGTKDTKPFVRGTSQCVLCVRGGKEHTRSRKGTGTVSGRSRRGCRVGRDVQPITMRRPKGRGE